MLIDMFTTVLHIIVTMTSGIVHTVDIMLYADLLSVLFWQQILLQIWHGQQSTSHITTL